MGADQSGGRRGRSRVERGRFAIRNGWSVTDPVARFEPDERPQPNRRRQRVLGREEIRRLLAALPPAIPDR